MSSRATFSALGLAAVVLAACGPGEPPTPDPIECTLIGCSDSVTVIIDGELPTEYSLVLAAPGLNTVTVRCPSGEVEGAFPVGPDACQAGTFTFMDYAPDQLELTLRYGGTERSESFTPTYETLRPNGPDCPPACRVGQIVLAVP